MFSNNDVVKVLVAEQMDLRAIRGFATWITIQGPAGWTGYVHEEKPTKPLEPGLHFVYLPKLKPQEIVDITADGSYFGLMVRPKAILPETNVKAVVRVGTGVGNLKDWWLAQDDRVVMNTPAQNAVATAEYAAKAVIELIAPTSFRRAHREVMAGELTSADLSGYTSSKETNGKTCLIAGMGDIGVEAAKRLKPWMNLIGWGYTREDGSPSFTPEKARKMGIGYAATLEEGIAQADALDIHVKGNAQVITGSVLQAAEHGLVIVNAARAECIDTDALGDAVREGIVRGFIVDADRFLDGDGHPDIERDKLQPYIEIAKRFPENQDLLVNPHLAGDVTMETNRAATLQGLREIAAAIFEGKLINARGKKDFGKDRPAVPAGYTDGGVEKPAGVGVIEGMVPSILGTDVEDAGISRSLQRK